ncbi:LptF/LptG family permease [Chlamydia abortus]|uniref:LptF/LptG family permease n=1 Tax=Chlamydia abortus TaxID=83555 RepID=UPI0011ED63C5|nr:LptF/LptG family permease [Chlamydia abortus]QEM74072.1 LptF/LptG family permease [Chlamydia abortus]
MPILWKVLIFRYLKTVTFCTLSLICISIISSLQEIVSYIAKDVPYPTVLRLTAYQIPYLLPFILPISCFISAFSLFRGLSDNNQITFLKASGASQAIITFPVLMVSCAICCVNFYTCSELASICRFQTCKEIANMAMTSPTLLLQTLQKKESNRIFITVDHCAKSKFDNVIIALKRDKEIANVGLIKTIIPDVANDTVQARGVVMISKLPSTLTDQRSSHSKEYYIETLDEMLIPKITSTLFAGKSYMKTRTDYLPWKQLVKQSFSRTYLPETLRRIGIGLLCITLTYSGMVLGTYKPRFRKSITLYCIFPVMDLILLIVGKNTSSLFPALMLFIFPQVISWIVFAIKAYRENRGYA